MKQLIAKLPNENSSSRFLVRPWRELFKVNEKTVYILKNLSLSDFTTHAQSESYLATVKEHLLQVCNFCCLATEDESKGPEDDRRPPTTDQNLEDEENVLFVYRVNLKFRNITKSNICKVTSKR